MGPFGQSLIKSGWYLYENKRYGHRHPVKTWEPEKTPTGPLILDIQPPDCEQVHSCNLSFPFMLLYYNLAIRLIKGQLQQISPTRKTPRLPVFSCFRLCQPLLYLAAKIFQKRQTQNPLRHIWTLKKKSFPHHCKTLYSSLFLFWTHRKQLATTH